MTVLGDALDFVGVPERIREPAKEKFVTLKVKGGGAVQRAIKDGKTPVPFTGYRIHAGQFIYSRIDARNGAFALVPEALDGAVVSKDFPVFRVRETADPAYLLHFMRAGQLESQIRASSFGATNRQRITEEVLLGFAIPLPPLEEQRRIAGILDAAEAIRIKRRAILKQLDALTQAVFSRMFRDGAFPDVAAGKLMPEMRNGLSPATAGEYPAQVLTLSAVTQGAFDPTAVKAGVFAIDPPVDKRVSARDFLMCRGNGNKALVGVGTYSEVDRADLVFPDTVIAGRIATERISMPFLDAAWKQPSVRKQIESVARTTNGTYKVNQQSLSTVTVPVPPLANQLDFTARSARIDLQRAAVRRALAADDELLVSLRSRAFTGKL